MPDRWVGAVFTGGANAEGRYRGPRKEAALQKRQDATPPKRRAVAIFRCELPLMDVRGRRRNRGARAEFASGVSIRYMDPHPLPSVSADEGPRVGPMVIPETPNRPPADPGIERAASAGMPLSARARTSKWASVAEFDQPPLRRPPPLLSPPPGGAIFFRNG